MATKKKPMFEDYGEVPRTLDDHPFFGIIPDKEQKVLMDAVWKREKKIFLVDSIAGSGKTLIATALGVLMVKHGLYNKIVYITFPGIYEKTQGFWRNIEFTLWTGRMVQKRLIYGYDKFCN